MSESKEHLCIPFGKKFKKLKGISSTKAKAVRKETKKISKKNILYFIFSTPLGFHSKGVPLYFYDAAIKKAGSIEKADKLMYNAFNSYYGLDIKENDTVYNCKETRDVIYHNLSNATSYQLEEAEGNLIISLIDLNSIN
tara:strand:- start:82 stop:498 length:417 start_codon:yes stop_codon:yes gene_type:complete